MQTVFVPLCNPSIKMKQEIDKYQQEIIEKITKAISKKCIVEFRYMDKTKELQTTRNVEPYLLGINKQGNLFLSGYFKATEEQLKEGMKAGHKNFLIDKITPQSLKILHKRFDSLKVENPDKIYLTKETTVLSAVYFPEIVLKDYTSPSIEIKEKEINKEKVLKLSKKEQLQFAEELWKNVENGLMPHHEDITFEVARSKRQKANSGKDVSLKQLNSNYWDESMGIPLVQQALVQERKQNAEENPDNLIDWEEASKTCPLNDDLSGHNP